MVINDCGMSLGEDRITDLNFAENILIFAETLEVVLHAPGQIEKKIRTTWMKVS